MPKKEMNKNSRRLLVLIYDMSDGQEGVRLHRVDIEKRIDELKLFDMSDEEFKAYRKRVLDRVRLSRN